MDDICFVGEDMKHTEHETIDDCLYDIEMAVRIIKNISSEKSSQTVAIDKLLIALNCAMKWAICHHLALKDE